MKRQKSIPKAPLNSLISLIHYARQNNGSPKDIHSLLIGTFVYITYMVKVTFQMWSGLRTVRRRDCPELSGWTQHNKEGPLK